MFRSWKMDKRGITLIEAVISVLIMGITLSTMLGTFVIGRISTIKAKHRMEAMNYARSAMEQLRDDLSSIYTLPDGDIKDLDGNCPPPSISNYEPGVKKVTVTISWTERSMGSSTYVSEQLTTLIWE